MPGPTLLDAASLLCEVADDLVVRSARDTHVAVLDRLHGLQRRVTRSDPGLVERSHRALAGTVYGGVGLGLRSASHGLDRLSERVGGPALEEGARGRFVSSAVNGLIGDKLLQERPQMAIAMAVRHRGGDVELTRPALATAFPDAAGVLVVFMHGLCENESYWNHRREERGTTYGEFVAGLGHTPVFLRANTGLPIRRNGVELTVLLDRLVAAWPVPVTRIVLVGHSMGGLIIRAAGAVAVPGTTPAWVDLVSDVITLGTPHLGAPIAWGIGHGARGLQVLPETAAFGRLLEWRSAGVRDLVLGLAEDVPPLPHARYRLVSATLTASERHPVGQVVGDLLVRPRSAYGRDRTGRTLFPDAEILHLGQTDHFGLLNHAEVERAMGEWLA